MIDLKSIHKGKVQRPERIMVMGVEGVGKSTFGACAPSPIFLAAEDGTDNLDVARFPRPTKWADVMESLAALTQPHTYQTLVVDTLDALEPLVWAEVCRTGGKTDIEAFGYGKGYAAAVDVWRQFLAALERLPRMRIILLAHTVIKPFRNPEGDDYDRYVSKLHPSAAGLIREWTDVNLFARFEVLASKLKGESKAKGVSTGARVMHTTRSAAFDAKNRYGLPDTLPLDWSAFAEAMGGRSAATVRAEIDGRLAGQDEETIKKVRASVAKAGDDVATLDRINNKLAALAVKESA